MSKQSFVTYRGNLAGKPVLISFFLFSMLVFGNIIPDQYHLYDNNLIEYTWNEILPEEARENIDADDYLNQDQFVVYISATDLLNLCRTPLNVKKGMVVILKPPPEQIVLFQ